MKLPSFFNRFKSDKPKEEKPKVEPKPKPKKKVRTSISKKRDSLIGLPVLFTLSGFSQVRNISLPDTINRIGILRLSSIRDTVFTYTALRALKEAYPNAKIIFFAGDENYHVAQIMPGVSGVIRLDHNDISKSIKKVKQAGTFDLWVDFGVWTRLEAIMSQSANANFKIGFKTENTMRHFAYDRIIDYSYEIHEKDNIDRLLNTIGINITDSSFPKILRNKIDEKLVIFDLFSDTEFQENRKWALENWKVVAEYLTSIGIRIALIGPKKFVPIAEEFNDLVGANADIDFLVGRLDFPATIDLISQSKIVIGGDTGILHVASMLGVPVIGLYGPTDTKLYGPIGNQVYTVSSSGCSSCQNIYGDETCNMVEADCMDSIAPEMVIRYIDEIINYKEEEEAKTSTRKTSSNPLINEYLKKLHEEEKNNMESATSNTDNGDNFEDLTMPDVNNLNTDNK